jgi:hypothetical protein
VSLSDDAGKLVGKVKSRLARRQLAKRLTARYQPLRPGEYQVAVYFGDPVTYLYQLRPWLPVLRELAQQVGVVVIFRSADAALAAMDDPTFDLPVAYASAHRDIDPIIASQDLKVVFYVNHHKSNFAMLWQPSVLHIYVGHGESDKAAISASNQLKAYDFTFVAGQAAIDRVNRRLINFDAETRLIRVGRPQLAQPQVDRAPTSNKEFTVLYAPSWEGDRTFNNYGSVRSHGEALIDGLLRDGRFRVIFRPHPLTGKLDRAYAAAADRISAALATARSAEPSAGHVTDTTNEFGWQVLAADYCIADVSAVALDWLASGKPLVIAAPSHPDAVVEPGSVIARLPMVWAERSADIAAVLMASAQASTAQELAAAREYCFGDTTPGVANQHFLTATQDLMELRDCQVALLPPS